MSNRYKNRSFFSFRKSFPYARGKWFHLGQNFIFIIVSRKFPFDVAGMFASSGAVNADVGRTHPPFSDGAPVARQPWRGAGAGFLVFGRVWLPAFCGPFADNAGGWLCTFRRLPAKAACHSAVTGCGGASGTPPCARPGAAVGPEAPQFRNLLVSERGLQTFPVKGRAELTFSFGGHVVSVATTVCASYRESHHRQRVNECVCVLERTRRTRTFMFCVNFMSFYIIFKKWP